MSQPKKVPIKTDDGGKTFYVFEPTPQNLVYQQAYICAACYANGISVAVGGIPNCGMYFGHYQLEKCPVCEAPQDWAQANAEQEKSDVAFKVWFDENQENGIVSMINEQGTGFLQRGIKEATS